MDFLSKENLTSNTIINESDYLSIVDTLRTTDYAHLKNQIYLDHAGTTVYSSKVIESFSNLLTTNLFGNPHSFMSPSSSLTSEGIQSIRLMVLDTFNVSSYDYSLIFTQSATDSLNKLAHYLQGITEFVYHPHSHTSVIGIRHTLQQRSNTIKCTESSIPPISKTALFAYPAQCNATGIRFPLIDTTCLSLVDVSSLLTTSQLSLTLIKPSFLVFSFYKLFGFPTGLGCLLVKKSCEHLIMPDYFGGGNVTLVNNDRVVFKRSLSDRLEHGTLNFQSILGLKGCYAYVNEVFGGFERISRHALYLRRRMVTKMENLRHFNNKPVVEIGYDDDQVNYGPIIMFWVLGSDGVRVGAEEVMGLAGLNNIHLRGGCFCNPGTCEDTKEESKDIQRTQCGFGNGKGSLRVSFGMSSTRSDIDASIRFLDTYFVVKKQAIKVNEEQEFVVEGLFVYPIKSCAGMKIDSLVLGVNGFKFDRMWMLVDSDDRPLKLRTNLKMLNIKVVRVDEFELLIDIGGTEILVYSNDDSNQKEMTVCGTKRCVQSNTCEANNKVSEFISKYLGVKCKLVKSVNSTGFANQSEYLVVSRDSFNQVNQWIMLQNKKSIDIECFRGNIVVKSLKGNASFYEDQWSSFEIGSLAFKCIELCERCQTVCIYPGDPSEPLSTLAKHRRINRKIVFGVHCKLMVGHGHMISIGSSIKYSKSIP